MKRKILFVLFFFGVGCIIFTREGGSQTIVGKLKRGAILTAEKIMGYNLSLKEAMWYRKIVDGSVQCLLCPLKCVIDEGGRGRCRVRANIDGRLRALTYGKPVLAFVNPPEKEIFFHCFPGGNSLIVATAGCNIECKWCQNWTISQALPENEKHYDLSPADVVKMAKEKNCNSIEFGYSEPIVFYEYMYDCARLAKEAGLKVLVKTAGYINPEPLRELLKYVDIINIDIKGFNEENYIRFCNAELQPILDAIKIAKESGVLVEISYIIVPDITDNIKDIERSLTWIKENLGPETPLYFIRFIPNYKLADKAPTPFQTLEKAYKLAAEFGFYYPYVIIVPGNPYEDTYCPVCKKRIVDREGFIVKENHIKGGRCEYCGAKIYGIFK